jgi:hypothetical protein
MEVLENRSSYWADGLYIVTPTGRLIGSFLAWGAMYETDVRALRISAGRTAGWIRGVFLGGSSHGRRSKVTRLQCLSVPSIGFVRPDV